MFVSGLTVSRLPLEKLGRRTLGNSDSFTTPTGPERTSETSTGPENGHQRTRCRNTSTHRRKSQQLMKRWLTCQMSFRTTFAKTDCPVRRSSTKVVRRLSCPKDFALPPTTKAAGVRWESTLRFPLPVTLTFAHRSIRLLRPAKEKLVSCSAGRLKNLVTAFQWPEHATSRIMQKK